MVDLGEMRWRQWLQMVALLKAWVDVAASWVSLSSFIFYLSICSCCQALSVHWVAMPLCANLLVCVKFQFMPSVSMWWVLVHAKLLVMTELSLSIEFSFIYWALVLSNLCMPSASVAKL